MKRVAAATGLLALVSLAACGGGSGKSSASTSAVSSLSEEATTTTVSNGAVSTEGSVTTPDGRFVQYPDGLTITFVSAKDVSSQALAKYPENFDGSDGDGDYNATKNSIIRVELRAENKGATTITLDPDYATIEHCLYGQNQTEDDGTVAIMGDTLLTSKEPTRLVAGSSISMWASCAVPRNSTSISAAIGVGKFTPASGSFDSYTPCTFTDLDKVLK